MLAALLLASFLPLWQGPDPGFCPVLQAADSHISPLLWSSDGSILATTSGETIVLWDVETGVLLNSWIPGKVFTAAFDSESRYLACGTQVGCVVYRLGQDEPVRIYEEPLVVANSPLGLIGVSSSGAVNVLLSGNQVCRLERYSMMGYGPSVRASGSSDLLIGRTINGAIGQWNLRTGDLIHEYEATVYAASQDLRYVATRQPNSPQAPFEIIDMDTRRQVYTIPAGSYNAAFSANGQFFAFRDSNNRLCISDIANDKVRNTNLPSRAVLSPDFSRCAIEQPARVDILHVADGSMKRTLSAPPIRSQVALSADGNALLFVRGNSPEHSLVRLDIHTGRLQAPVGKLVTMAKNDSGCATFAALESSGYLEVVDLSVWRRTFHSRIEYDTNGLQLSPDGRFVAAIGNNKDRILYDVTNRSPREVRRFTCKGRLLGFSAGRVLAPEGEHGEKWLLFDPASMRVVAKTTTFREPPMWYATTPDRKSLIVGYAGKTYVHDANTLQRLRAIKGIATRLVLGDKDSILGFAAPAFVLRSWNVDSRLPESVFDANDYARPFHEEIAVHPNGRYLLLSAFTGLATVWDRKTGKASVRIVMTDKNWVVVDEEGRFDLQTFFEPIPLRYTLRRSKLVSLPVQALIKPKYVPGLLRRIWKGERLPDTERMSTFNTLLPKVKFREARIGQDNRVSLRIEVNSIVGSGARDLRICRNGVLVRRIDGALGADGTEREYIIENLPLPSASLGRNEFTAYCFNSSGAKGEEATFGLPSSGAGNRARKLYVVSVGINSYQEGSGFSQLKYAVSDAERFSEVIGDRLGGFETCIIKVLSQDKQTTVQKDAIAKVFQVLGGQVEINQLPATVQVSGRLQAATPNDLVVIFWSGHGDSEPGGRFFLIPGDAASKSQDPARNSWISNAELGRWLEAIDAAQVFGVIDTCHSGAAIDDGQFRPAPQNVDGLGQTAFDKGFLLLAACAPDGLAFESPRFGGGMGYLTYSLLSVLEDAGKSQERLEFGDWLGRAANLGYGDEYNVGQRNLDTGARGVTVVMESALSRRAFQSPVLFDFRRPSSYVGIYVKTGAQSGQFGMHDMATFIERTRPRRQSSISQRDRR